MRDRLLLLAWLLSMSACATAPAPEPTVHAARARHVLDPLLTRRNGAAGIFAVHRDVEPVIDNCLHRIYLDDNAVADLRANEVVHIYAPPGRHQLRVEPNGIDCRGGAYEVVAISEQGTSQSFKTAASSGRLLISAAD